MSADGLLSLAVGDPLVVVNETGRLDLRHVAKVGKVHVTDNRGAKWNDRGSEPGSTTWSREHARRVEPEDHDVLTRQRAITKAWSAAVKIAGVKRWRLDEIPADKLARFTAALEAALAEVTP